MSSDKPFFQTYVHVNNFAAFKLMVISKARSGALPSPFLILDDFNLKAGSPCPQEKFT